MGAYHKGRCGCCLADAGPTRNRPVVLLRSLGAIAADFYGRMKRAVQYYGGVGQLARWATTASDPRHDGDDMTTIPIEAQVSTEQLLRAVEQLPPQELAAFVAQVVALRAQREAPHLGQPETTLLLQINRGIPAETQRRFDELVAKRQAETITPDELRELIRITDQIEQRDVERLTALIELARLRRTTLDDLMGTLGIKPPAYA